jgi:hypothetical protein
MLSAEAGDLLGRVKRGVRDRTDHTASPSPVCPLKELAMPPASEAAE